MMKCMFFAALILWLCGVPAFAADDEVGAGQDCVILLHGLGRSARAMSFIEGHLQTGGYSTVNLSYPSTSEPIEVLANSFVDVAVKQCQALSPTKIHFVTHSMGGILARQYLQSHSLPAGSRMVMLSPPNHGSELIDGLRGNPLLRFALGPAALQLATDSDLLSTLKAVEIDVGIIMGDAGDSWFGLPQPNDNAVTVASARLAEMRDFLVLPHNHINIRRSVLVIRQLLVFLRQGRFDHEQAPAAALMEKTSLASRSLRPLLVD